MIKLIKFKVIWYTLLGALLEFDVEESCRSHGAVEAQRVEVLQVSELQVLYLWSFHIGLQLRKLKDLSSSSLT
jgi:hypothetical protein